MSGNIQKTTASTFEIPQARAETLLKASEAIIQIMAVVTGTLLVCSLVYMILAHNGYASVKELLGISSATVIAFAPISFLNLFQNWVADRSGINLAERGQSHGRVTQPEEKS